MTKKVVQRKRVTRKRKVKPINRKPKTMVTKRKPKLNPRNQCDSSCACQQSKAKTSRKRKAPVKKKVKKPEDKAPVNKQVSEQKPEDKVPVDKKNKKQKQGEKVPVNKKVKKRKAEKKVRLIGRRASLTSLMEPEDKHLEPPEQFED